jgi:hypothetical protein
MINSLPIKHHINYHSKMIFITLFLTHGLSLPTPIPEPAPQFLAAMMNIGTSVSPFGASDWPQGTGYGGVVLGGIGTGYGYGYGYGGMRGPGGMRNPYLGVAF